MGIFKNLFGSEEKENEKVKKETPWIDLNSMDQLDEIEKISEEKTVAILKHSTRCGISRMVLKMFESDYDLDASDSIALYYLDLITYREISNEIASRFNVRHESPQLIVIKDGQVVHHSSHQAISANKLADFVS